MTATPRPQPPFTERTPTVNWTLRRAVGKALGYEPHPVYDWGWVNGDEIGEYPAWDTDLNAAITLVSGLNFRVHNLPNGWFSHPESTYRVAITDEKGYHILANEYAPTLALAICRAFLAYNAKMQKGASQ